MSPLPATIVFTARPDLLAKASVRTRKIPLSCVVVVVRIMISLGLAGCAATGVERPMTMAKAATASERARRIISNLLRHPSQGDVIEFVGSFRNRRPDRATG